MKKITVIIVAVVLCIALAGYVGATYLGSGILQTVTNKENDIPKENSNAEQNAEVTANEDTLSNNQETVIEPLSEQDKTVKEEIAKFVTTDVDFRYETQEIIADKQIDVKFSKVTDLDDIGKMITYISDDGDKIMYNCNTGKLFLARLKYEKTTGNISIDTAQKIADDFVYGIYDANDFDFKEKFEYDSNSYLFVYQKLISGYESDATYEIKIDKSGNVIYLRDAVDYLKGIETQIDVQKIEEYKENLLKKYESEGAIIDLMYITKRDGKLQVAISILHGINDDGTIGTDKEFMFFEL